jgi:hypothetical protein
MVKGVSEQGWRKQLCLLALTVQVGVATSMQDMQAPLLHDVDRPFISAVPLAR